MLCVENNQNIVDNSDKSVDKVNLCGNLFTIYPRMTSEICHEIHIRTVRLFAGMTGEYVIIQTDAPDDLIKEQIRVNNQDLEQGKEITDEFSFITDKGYNVEVLCDHDSNDGVECDVEIDLYAY